MFNRRLFSVLALSALAVAATFYCSKALARSAGEVPAGTGEVPVGTIVELVPTGQHRAQSYVVVENYEGTVHTKVDLPGQATTNGIFFSGEQEIVKLAFEPGVVHFDGRAIDFSGHESQFLGRNYSGSMILDLDTNGPLNRRTTVAGEGDAKAIGPVEASGKFSYAHVTLDPGFSRSSVALTVGSTPQLMAFSDNWQSVVIPELNGLATASACSLAIAEVDAINGLITRDFSGQILAAVPVMSLGSLDGVPGRSSGAWMLALGGLGFGLVYARRR